MSDTPATILIVEDEALVCEVAAMEFEDGGWQVLTTSDGAEALRLLAGDAGIDVLFTDIGLRDAVDGWQVAAEARALRPGLQVIYATGYAPDPQRAVAGAMFFRKPYVPSEILAAANELMARTG